MALESGEQELWSKRANHSAGWRAVGGKLYLTDRRLVFRPHAFDRLLAAKEWSVPRAEIAGFGVEGAAATFGVRQRFSGALRSRLRVELRQGEPQFFVVSKPDQAAKELDALLGSGD